MGKQHSVALAVLLAFPVACFSLESEPATAELRFAKKLVKNSASSKPKAMALGRPQIAEGTAIGSPLDLKFSGSLGPVSGATAAPGKAFRQPAAPLPTGAVQPGPAFGASVSEAVNSDGQSTDESTFLDWTIPPIRWGGQIGTSVSSQKSDTLTSKGNTQVFSISGSSYVYAPWFAQVSGSVDLYSATASTVSDVDESSSQSNGANFSATLGLYPVSRFPLQASVEHTDSRAASNVTGTQFTTSRFGLNQNWRPEVGNESASGSLQSSVIETAQYRSAVNAIRANYSNILKDHTLSGSMSYSGNRGDIGGQHSGLFSLSGNHAWRDPDEEYTLASYASLSHNEIGLLRADGLDNLSSQFLQVGSGGTWIPFEEDPLTINGGINFLASNTNTLVDTIKVTGVNSYANTSYMFSRNLSASAGLTMQYMNLSGQGVASLGEIGTLSYAGDPVAVGEYLYGWGLSTSLSNQNTSTGMKSTSLASSAQHMLSRTFTFANSRMISLSGSQSYALFNGKSSGEGAVNANSSSLSHSLAVSWSEPVSEGGTGNASVMLYDSESNGALSSHFRNLSVQGGLQAQLSRNSSFGFNVSMNGTQQFGNGKEKVGDDVLWTGAGGANFTQRNPFDVSNLIYTVTVQVNKYQSNQRVLTGDPNALSWQSGATFQQALDYRLGRFKLRGTHSIIEISDKRNTGIYATLTRNFGAY